jgi:hypothetical protein
VIPDTGVRLFGLCRIYSRLPHQHLPTPPDESGAQIPVTLLNSIIYIYQRSFMSTPDQLPGNWKESMTGGHPTYLPGIFSVDRHAREIEATTSFIQC